MLAAGSLIEGLVLGANGPLLALLASDLEIVIAIAVLLLVPPERGWWRGAWPVLVLLAAACVWAGLPLCLQSITAPPDLVLPGLVRLIGSCATVIAASIVGYRRGLARTGVDWLIATGLFQIIVGLVLRSSDPTHVWGYVHTITGGRYSGTMINANANAVMSAVTAVLAFGRTQSFMRQESMTGLLDAMGRIICVLAAALAMGAGIISGSRVALVLMGVAVTLLVVRDPFYRVLLRGRRGQMMVAGALAFGAAIVLVTGAPSITRFATFSQDGAVRLLIWQHYGRLAITAPLFGYGLASFSEMNMATLHSLSDAANFWYINSAHNQVVELVLEGGAVYAATIIAAIGCMAGPAALSVARSRYDPVMRSCLAALGLIGLASQVDIALDVPAVVTLAATMLGLVWGRSIRARDTARRMQRIAAA